MDDAGEPVWFGFACFYREISMLEAILLRYCQFTKYVVSLIGRSVSYLLPDRVLRSVCPLRAEPPDHLGL